MIHRAAIVLLALASLLASPAVAQSVSGWQDGAVHVVSGVEVQRPATSPDAVRGLAFEDGRLIATRILFERLGPRAGGLRADDLDAAAQLDLVQHMQINEERFDRGIYYARMTVTFRPDAVEALLAGAPAPAPVPAPFVPGLAPTPTGSPTAPIAAPASPPAVSAQPGRTVLLPIYVTQAGRPVLWDQPNPWRDAWYAEETTADRLIVPFGDLADVRAITAEQAMTFDRPALDRIRSAYGADQVAVAVLREGGVPEITVAWPGAGAQPVDLGLRGGSMQTFVWASAEALTRALASPPSIGAAPGVVAGAAPPAGPTGAPVGAPLGGPIGAPVGAAPPVAAPPVAAPSRPWEPGLGTSLVVRVLFDSPESLIRIRSAILQADAVAAARTTAMTSREALVEIQFTGTLAQLEQSLARQGLGFSTLGGVAEVRQAR